MKPKRKPADIPVQKNMCATCPWREGSPYEHLRSGLARSALTEANRICHSTGEESIAYPRGTGKPERVCRGARDTQLAMFHGAGFLEAPTDEAWQKKLEEMRAQGSKI